MLYKLNDLYISQRINNLIIDYQIFSMFEYIEKKGEATDLVTEPVIETKDGKSFIIFQLGKIRHVISLPEDEWRLKIKKYYIIHILHYPRRCAKSIVEKTIDLGYNGSLCYIKKGFGALIYLELDDNIEKGFLKENNTPFNIQELAEKPYLKENNKWISLNTFLI